MRKWVGITLAAAFVALIGIVALCLTRPSPLHEPAYQGKPLSRWLLELGHPATDTAAEAALKEIGTNALPFLLHWLQATETPAETRFWMRVRSQSFVQVPWHTPGDRFNAAVAGCRALGPSAEVAIPDLISLFHNTNLIYGGENPAYQAARALEAIGPPAIPALLQAMTNPDASVRCHATFALGWYPSLRSNAAIPALIARLQDDYPPVRIRAAYALGALRQEPDLVVAALSRALGDSATPVRFTAAAALGEFGSQATNAVPALRNAFRMEKTVNHKTLPGRGVTVEEHSQEEVRLAISNAVVRIDPTANFAP